ncbi:MAG TPA: hypothetical protein VMC07_02595, partial [Candidatus Omnitrophota bacterium]|nr:hypothetical protein [Candidatus Omnitrophota bacterium]
SANTDGINYANEVLGMWVDWKNYISTEVLSSSEKAKNTCSACSLFSGGCTSDKCSSLSQDAASYGFKCQFANGQCSAVAI